MPLLALLVEGPVVTVVAGGVEAQLLRLHVLWVLCDRLVLQTWVLVANLPELKLQLQGLADLLDLRLASLSQVFEVSVVHGPELKLFFVQCWNLLAPGLLKSAREAFWPSLIDFEQLTLG